MNKLLVNTPQNVQIAYNIAPLGKRLLAYIIDMIIRIVLVYGMSYFSEFIPNRDEWFRMGIYSIIGFIFLLYPLILEILMKGQTVGKWIMKIRVIRMDGNRANNFDYFLRWVIGIVELFLFSGLIALITMIINKNGQRLGDIVANTCLIDLNPKLDLSQTIFAEVSETYKIRFPEVYRLSDRDINIVKENFTSALHNNNYDILLKLTRKLEEIMEVKSDGLGNIDFIQVVIQDHYHYHKDK
ncbi:MULTISPECIES: RDD family protein [Empedobacter]|uniref:RDD family protein n=1 Tax=Empedobacter TaxID=59734 RepID=UPI0025BABEA0|nr:MULTISPECIES: RDD family protein [unclassified Empedobacter]